MYSSYSGNESLSILANKELLYTIRTFGFWHKCDGIEGGRRIGFQGSEWLFSCQNRLF